MIYIPPKHTMDLFCILQSTLPPRKKLLSYVQATWAKDLSVFFLKLIKKTYKKNKDIMLLNLFFIELYDVLYEYIVFDKIYVTRNVLKILQELALPIEYIGSSRWLEGIRKVKKMKI